MIKRQRDGKGLAFPHDVAAWQRWERSRRPLRAAKAAVVGSLRRESPPRWVLNERGVAPRVLVAFDMVRITKADALIAPLTHVKEGMAVLSAGDVRGDLPGDGWRQREITHLGQLPSSVDVVLSAGSYGAVSLPVHAWARERGLRFVVVQHGLLTPYAPPLPAEVDLFAWSEQDGDFWTMGREDVRVTVVGSQLLWRAGQTSATATLDQPVFLGQLHGTELPLRDVARTTGSFCRTTGAVYRPHPAEVDRRSRGIHRLWRRQGIQFETSGLPLNQLGRPVVSIFSTGVLEAAVQGLPAWVHHPAPPLWLGEFWARYALGRWGSEPTNHAAPSAEPARLIAELVR